VKMRIHGLFLVHVYFAQTLIARESPVAFVSLKVAAKPLVMAGLFDDLVQMNCLSQRLLAASRLIILSQRINRERLSINPLFHVRRCCTVVEHPIHAPKLFVPEMAEDVVVGARRCPEIPIFPIYGEG